MLLGRPRCCCLLTLASSPGVPDSSRRPFTSKNRLLCCYGDQGQGSLLPGFCFSGGKGWRRWKSRRPATRRRRAYGSLWRKRREGGRRRRDKSGGGIKERDARDDGEIQSCAHWLPRRFPILFQKKKTMRDWIPSLPMHSIAALSGVGSSVFPIMARTWDLLPAYAALRCAARERVPRGAAGARGQHGRVGRLIPRWTAAIDCTGTLTLFFLPKIGWLDQF